MRHGLGIALLVIGSADALLAAFVLRPRAPAAVVGVMAVWAGAALGAGALLVQPHASAADWAVTVPLMALLIPVHIRIVFGSLGPRPGPAPGARTVD